MALSLLIALFCLSILKIFESRFNQKPTQFYTTFTGCFKGRAST